MRPHAKSFEGVVDLTRQSFKDECDVTRIVKQFTATGIVNHLARGTPQYGDAPEMDYHAAACIGAEIASKTEEGAFEPDPEATPAEPENASEDDSEAPTADSDPPPSDPPEGG